MSWEEENDFEISIEEEKNTLTPFQEIVIEKIYDSAKVTIKEVQDDPEMSDVLVITTSIIKLCGLIECIKINDTKLKGNDKKNIVLHLGRKILIDILPYDKVSNIIVIYDTTASNVLDMLIKFAKYNKVVKKITQPCILCGDLF